MRRFFLPFVPGTCLALALSSCGGPPAPEVEEPPVLAVTRWTDSTELFMEHPVLVAGVPAKFAIHLTDLTDFRPLESGTVTLHFRPRQGGAATTVTQESPRVPGIFGPEVTVSTPGLYDLDLVVESPQARDSIRIADVTVHAALADAAVEEEGDESGIAFLKEQQWNTAGFATAFADSGSVARTVSAPGRVIPAAGRYATVEAPMAGVLQPAGVGRSPSLGARVGPGEVLAILTPTLGEGGGAYAAARAALREAEDEYARVRRLLAAEAVPERRVHEASIRLDAAREALAGLGGSDAEDGRLALRAPVGGVLAERLVVPGAVVAPGDRLFTILDPTTLWLEVRVAAQDWRALGTPRAAQFRRAGDATGQPAGRVVSMSPLIDSLTRSVSVIFELPNPDGLLRPGELVDAWLATASLDRGVVIPRGAVLDEDGQPVAYVQVDGETFERRVVTLGASDGARVVVQAGLRAGERVVTGAAPIVRLAARSTSLPAHGHEH